jgi:hypothetical protein
MITIDLQDDDANQTKKANRLQEDKRRRRRQQGLAGNNSELKNQFTPQSELGLIARILSFFKKE